jgi:hypothetical protein
VSAMKTKIANKAIEISTMPNASLPGVLPNRWPTQTS